MKKLSTILVFACHFCTYAQKKHSLFLTSTFSENSSLIRQNGSQMNALANNLVDPNAGIGAEYVYSKKRWMLGSQIAISKTNTRASNLTNAIGQNVNFQKRFLTQTVSLKYNLMKHFVPVIGLNVDFLNDKSVSSNSPINFNNKFVGAMAGIEAPIGRISLFANYNKSFSSYLNLKINSEAEANYYINKTNIGIKFRLLNK